MDTPEQLLTIKQTAALESCSVSEIYNRLSRTEYFAVKDGAKTLIPITSINARRATKLKPAVFKPYASQNPPQKPPDDNPSPS